MCEFRTFNQWIPHFSISETFQKDGEEVISCPEISKMHMGIKHRDLESTCQVLTSCLRKWKSESHSVVSNSLQPRGLDSPRNSPGQNTGVGNLSLLQGSFPSQRSNPDLLHCRRILYQLNHQGSPRILEWVAIPSPGDLRDPGIEQGSPALLADSLPTELPGLPYSQISIKKN